MIRAIPVFAALALLSLGVCDRGSPPPPAPANTEAAAEAIAKIEALPAGQLNIVLFRAIRDAGHPCQGIKVAQRIADADGHPRWAAQCERGDGQFVLVLNKEGLMTVTPGRIQGHPDPDQQR